MYRKHDSMKTKEKTFSCETELLPKPGPCQKPQDFLHFAWKTFTQGNTVNLIH